jgi:CheY-like chemotaxis protein
VLDVRLPDGDGVTVCREIRSALPETACLMLTAYGDDQALLGAIMAGAAGYVSKQTRASAARRLTCPAEGWAYCRSWTSVSGAPKPAKAGPGRLATTARSFHAPSSPAVTPAPTAARVSRSRVRSAEQAQVRPAATA